LAQAGNDPAVAKREARIAKRVASANTFAAVADEYIAKLEAEGRAVRGRAGGAKSQRRRDDPAGDAHFECPPMAVAGDSDAQSERQGEKGAR